MLLHIENVLTADELREINALLAETELVDGRASAGYQSAGVKRNLQLPESSPLAAKLGNRVLAALERCPLFTSAALPRRIYPPMFSYYRGGMGFGDHVDNAVRGDSQPMRTDLSVTLFLSDPGDYSGGDLVINDTYGAHAVKLPAGDLVLYPSSSLHRVNPVIDGVRKVCFFWVQSMIRDNAQRAMLYELDRAIIGLHQAVPDNRNNPDLLRIINCYHNLLRQWAEV